jgi:UDPglucose 6-dehydrogenase
METVEGADALVLLTEWNEFRAVDLKQFRIKMRGNVLVDLRNVYQQALAEAAGFDYSGVGRGSARRFATTAPQRPRERGSAAA